MKTPTLISCVCLLSLSLGAQAASTPSTINPTNHNAYGANIGWIDWRADATNGAVVNESFCSGYLYSANVGWINLGSGAPANRMGYQNLATNDFGVNVDSVGNLRGLAWGANIGWINFELQGAPKVDLFTGKFSGSAWSANCGWISLSNATALVQTDHVLMGPLDANALPLAWELSHFGQTGIDPNADPDHDGKSNLQEYLAGTDPNSANDSLYITSAQFATNGTAATLTWPTVPTRFYRVQKTSDLTSWTDSSLGDVYPSGLAATRTVTQTNAPFQFYRITALRPLP